MAELPLLPGSKSPCRPLGCGSLGKKTSLLAGASVATTCMATDLTCQESCIWKSLERAVLKRLPQQTASGSMAKLEKLPLSQKDQASRNK